MSCTASGYRLKDSDYPAVPEKSGYTGTWTKYTDAIVSDIQVNATYKRTTPVPTVRPTGGVVASLTEEPTEPDVPPVEEELMEDLEPQESPAEQENTQTEPIATQAQMTTTHTVQHDYVTQSGRLVREKVTEDGTLTAVMDFVYDESGRPLAVLYSTNGTAFTTYYYILNLQGDVVKLIGTDGSIAASYTYDAWGNILSSSGTMANINPLRYRGYYYDGETGFYYLQSRYYDPVNRRFLNADSLASTGEGFTGTNAFAYCGNNPVSYHDEGGESREYFTFYWAFHRYVQMAIKATNADIRIEAGVNLANGGYGRLDVYQNNCVWEVKSMGSHALAREQVRKYLNGTLCVGGDPVLYLGAKGSFTGTFTKTYAGKEYMVHYTTPEDGVVLYVVTLVPQPEKEAVREPAYVSVRERSRSTSTLRSERSISWAPKPQSMMTVYAAFGFGICCGAFCHFWTQEIR